MEFLLSMLLRVDFSLTPNQIRLALGKGVSLCKSDGGLEVNINGGNLTVNHWHYTRRNLEMVITRIYQNMG